MRTITDAAKIVGLSRRVIQEYEKDGVAIKPSQKNKYGYLIYDDTTIDRLWQIRFYRELGYDKRAIKAVFDDPDYDYTAALEAQVKLLEKKKLEIENLIGVANLMKETGLTPKALHLQTAILDGLTFNDTFGVLGAISRCLPHGDEETEDSPVSDEEIERIFEAFEYVLSQYKAGAAYDEDSVQTAVQEFHKLASPWLSDTVSGLMMVSFLIAPGSKGAEELEADYELPGAADFIQRAVHKYYDDNIDKGADKILNDALEEIVSFGKKKYKPWSEEVQAVVAKVYDFYATTFNSMFISPREMMKRSILLYADPGFYAFFDKVTHGKGAGKYVSAAFKHYCKKFDNPEQ